MKIKIHLISQSKEMAYENVKNAYTKNELYCIYKDDNTVDKFPLINIFRITESYK